MISAVVADMGGPDRMSETKMQLARRFAALAVQAEQMEAKLANGEAIDIGEYSQLTSTLVRVVTRIGIKRIPKNITPSVADYIEAVAVAAREGDE